MLSCMLSCINWPEPHRWRCRITSTCLSCAELHCCSATRHWSGELWDSDPKSALPCFQQECWWETKIWFPASPSRHQTVPLRPPARCSGRMIIAGPAFSGSGQNILAFDWWVAVHMRREMFTIQSTPTVADVYLLKSSQKNNAKAFKPSHNSNIFYITVQNNSDLEHTWSMAESTREILSSNGKISLVHKIAFENWINLST